MLRRVLFLVCCSFCFVLPATAAELLRLPYAAGESMLVSRGYDTPATHVNKDRYALDFVQGGCISFGKEVRAVRSGVVSFVNTKDTWGGGYGRNVILDHEDGTISRYAHFSAYANQIGKGMFILRGQTIGYQGNTGNVLGAACKEHPGTHLHFSFLQQGQPIKPEPMSLYEQFVPGNWYRSDNIYPDSGVDNIIKQDVPSSQIINKPEESWIISLWRAVTSFFHTDSNQEQVKQEQNNSDQKDVQLNQVILPAKENIQPLSVQGAFELQEIIVDVPVGAKEISVPVRVQNTGKSTWPSSSISLNVVGGEKIALPFHHSTWATYLRPSVIKEEVKPNTGNIIPVMITIPADTQYNEIQFQLVYFNEKQFSRIDTAYVKIKLVRTSSDVVMLPEEKLNAPQEIAVSHTPSLAPALLYIPEVKPSNVPVSSGPNIQLAYTSNPETPLVVAMAPDIFYSQPYADPVPLYLSTSSVQTVSSTPLEVHTTSTISIEQVVDITTSSPPIIEEIGIPSIENGTVITLPSSTPNTFSTSTDIVVTSSEKISPIVDTGPMITIPLYCGGIPGANIVSSTGYLDIIEAQYLRTSMFDDKNTVLLTAENGPYVFGPDTRIPKGKILLIQEGVVLMGVDKNAMFEVEGEIRADGSENKPIRMTSACDEKAQQPGDWSYIHIAPGGVGTLKRVHITYAGNPFTLSYGTLASSDVVSRVIFNQGGTLQLDQVKIDKSYVLTTNELLNAYVWTEHASDFSPTTVSEYSSYSDGFAAIHYEGKNDNQRITGKIIGNTFTHFSSSRGPLSFYRDMPFMGSVFMENNVNNSIYLSDVHIIDSVQLQKDITYLLSGITIEKNASLYVPAGIVFRLLPGTDIFVNGELIVEGTEEHPVIIQADSTLWGSIIFSEAKGKMVGVDMSGGGLSLSTPPGRSRMVYVVNSTVSVDDAYIHDSRVPGALVEADHSTMIISNSIFSWASRPIVSSWITYGIFMNDGEVSLDDNIFHNVVMPLYTTQKTIIKETETEEVFESV